MFNGGTFADWSWSNADEKVFRSSALLGWSNTMKRGAKASDSGSVYLRLGCITLAVGAVLAGRALYHIIWHKELSFLSDGMKALLIIGLGALFFWGRWE